MPPRKQPDDYPLPRDNETVTQNAILVGKSNTFLIQTYESPKTISIYVGGHTKWCINCDLSKKDNKIQPLGYLNQIRYDIQCSLEHSFLKGKDTKILMYFLVQYINNTYPDVKELLFSDLSTKQCDDNKDVNLAVMTYLYTDQTWYEKNFGAYISPISDEEFKRIKTHYKKVDENNNNKVDWEEMRETIDNNELLTKMTDTDMEELYNKTTTWKEFFETIFEKIKIENFCIFISSWLPKFINKYFNNLQGLKYILPIRDYNIKYIESKYTRGGRRYTRKMIRKHDKDYK
jgi:hypothetical protein